MLVRSLTDASRPSIWLCTSLTASSRITNVGAVRCLENMTAARVMMAAEQMVITTSGRSWEGMLMMMSIPVQGYNCTSESHR